MTWLCEKGHSNMDTYTKCYECSMIASGKVRCTRCRQKRWHSKKFSCCLECFHELRPDLTRFGRMRA